MAHKKPKPRLDVNSPAFLAMLEREIERIIRARELYRDSWKDANYA